MRRTAILALIVTSVIALPALADLTPQDARKTADEARAAVRDMQKDAPQFAPVRDIFLRQCQTEFRSEDRKSKGKFCECGADIAMVLAIEELQGGGRKGSMDAMVGNFMKAGASENYAPLCEAAFL